MQLVEGLDLPLAPNRNRAGVRLPSARTAGFRPAIAAAGERVEDYLDAHTEVWPEMLDALPVASRVAQFAQDFTELSGTPWRYDVCDERTIELSLGDAMEFLETVSYTRNWLSEMHERFCALSWPDWQALIAEAGDDVAALRAMWSDAQARGASEAILNDIKTAATTAQNKEN